MLTKTVRSDSRNNQHFSEQGSHPSDWLVHTIFNHPPLYHCLASWCFFFELTRSGMGVTYSCHWARELQSTQATCFRRLLHAQSFRITCKVPRGLHDAIMQIYRRWHWHPLMADGSENAVRYLVNQHLICSKNSETNWGENTCKIKKTYAGCYCA